MDLIVLLKFVTGQIYDFSANNTINDTISRLVHFTSLTTGLTLAYHVHFRTFAVTGANKIMAPEVQQQMHWAHSSSDRCYQLVNRDNREAISEPRFYKW